MTIIQMRHRKTVSITDDATMISNLIVRLMNNDEKRAIGVLLTASATLAMSRLNIETAIRLLKVLLEELETA